MADQGAEGLLSPYLRKKRLEAAPPYLKGMILDFGCGVGELATIIPAAHYLGVEIDTFSREQAIVHFPHHHFVPELPQVSAKFDTIISLAVIEHVNNPAQFLQMLYPYLNNTPDSGIVVTTPHPFIDWIHKTGAFIGLFSKNASKEHEDLLDRKKLEKACRLASLKFISYHRFLFGANQIAVYAKGVV